MKPIRWLLLGMLALLALTSAALAQTWPHEPSGSTVLSDWGMDQVCGTNNCLIPGSGVWHDIYNVATVANNPNGLTAPLSPPGTLQFFYPQGFVEGTGPDRIEYYFGGTRQEIYFAFWWMPSNNWAPSSSCEKIAFIENMTPGGGAYAGYVIPCLRAQTNNGTAATYMVYFANSAGYLVDNCHLSNRYGPDCPGTQDLFGEDYYVTFGQWHRIEIYVKKSSTASSQDGILRTWIDGNNAMYYTTVNYPASGTSIQSVAFAPTYGGNSGVQKPHDDWYWYDHVRLSDPSTATGAPTANFTGTAPGGVTPPSGPIPLPVNFTDTSTGSPTGWSWAFGDGNCSPQPTCTQSNAQNPSHTYTVAGTYTVSLTATNGNGSDAEVKTNYVTATSGGVPAAPTGLQTTSVSSPASDMRIDLAWTAPSGSPTNYNLYKCVRNNGVQAAANCTPTLHQSQIGNVTAFQVTQLVPGTEYTFEVRATNANGEGPASNQVNGSTLQVGFATLYSGDVNIENDSRSKFVERFDASGGLGTARGCGSLSGSGDVTSRYNDTYNLGMISVVTTDGPANGNNHSLQIATTGATHAHLFKDLSETGLNSGSAPYFLRYYVKYLNTPTAYHHSSVWMGGMRGGFCGAANCKCPNPRAGCQPVGDDVIHAGLEPEGSDWNSYLYWMGMRPANDFSCDASYNCTITPPITNQCFWGDTTLNDQSIAITSGAWNLVEIMVKPNNPVGTSNGEYAGWVNGIKVVHDSLNHPLGSWSGGGTQGIWTASTSGTPFPGLQWRGDANLDIAYLWINNDTYSAATTRYAHLVLATAYVGQIEPPTIPVADFSGTPTSGNPPLTVNFTDLSSGGPTSWEWDFDVAGGASVDSTSQNPSHQYNTPGQYTVSLKAINANGEHTATKNNYITVAGDTDPPAVPSGLAVSAVGPDRVFASWTANTEPDLAGYRLWRAGFLVCETTRLYCTESGLAANTSYGYAIEAYDAAGNPSGQSATQSATTATAPATTAVLSPSGTTWLNRNTSNPGADPVMQLYTWPAGCAGNVALLQFNVASIVPASATVSSAVLYALQNAPGSAGTYTIPVHRIINVTPNLALATGQTYDGSNNWTASPCGGSGFPMAQADIAAATTSTGTAQIAANMGAWRSWDITSMVQAWVDGSQVNRGLLLNADVTPSTDVDTNRSFASANEPLVGHRPFLVITYTGADVMAPAAPANLHVVHP